MSASFLNPADADAFIFMLLSEICTLVPMMACKYLMMEERVFHKVVLGSTSHCLFKRMLSAGYLVRYKIRCWDNVSVLFNLCIAFLCTAGT